MSKDNEKKQYSNIFNAKATNAIIRASKKHMNRTEEFDKEGIKIMGRENINGIEIVLGNFDKLKLTDNTRKLFDILTLKLTEQMNYGASDAEIVKACCVTIELDEYMQLCGLKDRKSAREQLRSNAYTLFNISLTWEEAGNENNPETGRKRRKKIHWSTHLFESKKEVSNLETDPIIDSSVTFRFAFDIIKYLSQKYIMPFKKEALLINFRKNPHAYCIARKLMEHYNINYKNDSKTPVRLSIDSLIKACPDLPRYEDISRHYTREIITPIENALDALVDEYGIIQQWIYCKRNGVLITDDENAERSFEDWRNWYIEFSLADYPNQSQKQHTKRKKKNQS